MAVTKVYEEVVDLIAAGEGPHAIASFRPSETSRARVTELLAREKAGRLDADETSELEHYLHLEHIMRLAKARARQLPPLPPTPGPLE